MITFRDTRWGFELVTPPTEEPVAVSYVRSHCRIDSAEEDQLIGDWMTAARTKVEKDAAIVLMESTWKLHLNRFPGEIEIRKVPVQSVTAVTYLDDSGDSQTVDAADYEAKLYLTPPVVSRAYGVEWPTTLIGELQAVSVTFVAGYETAADVPAAAKAAILLLVSHWYRSREAVGQAGDEIALGYESFIGQLRWSEYH